MAEATRTIGFVPNVRKRPRRLRLDQMRLLVAIAEAGSVSEAAHTQHVSQPAASRAIAELEQALGDRLFERLSRGVRLTPLGRAFADRAASIVRQTDAAEREFSDLRDGRRGAVMVGAVSGATGAIMFVLMFGSTVVFARQRPVGAKLARGALPVNRSDTAE